MSLVNSISIIARSKYKYSFFSQQYNMSIPITFRWNVFILVGNHAYFVVKVFLFHVFWTCIPVMAPGLHVVFRYTS